LSLTRALERAQLRAPLLAQAELARQVAVATQRSAAGRGWPTLSLETENVFGHGELRGLDAAETTLSIEQELGFGGKRRAERLAAQHGLDGADAASRLAKLQLQRDVGRAYGEAVANAQLAELARDRARLAAEMRTATERRHAEGLVSDLQRARSFVEGGAIQAATRRAQQQEQLSRQHLAAYWRETETSEPLDLGALKEVAARPAVARDLDPAHPVVQVAEHRLRQATASVDAASADRWSGLSAMLGVRHFAGAGSEGDRALVLGVSLPLDGQRASREALALARAAALDAELDLDIARRELRADAAAAAAELDAARIEMQALQDAGIPAAMQAAARVREAHAAGRVPIEERLQSEMGLIQLREQLVRAQLAAYRAVLVLEFCSARSASVAAATSSGASRGG
jgi:cobalt-zinc-cadmium efflux system outer membrane protein